MRFACVAWVAIALVAEFSVAEPFSAYSPGPLCVDFCAGASFHDSRYLCGDERLGPSVIPDGIEFYSSRTYRRFGGLCPADFLREWYGRPSILTAGTDLLSYNTARGFQVTKMGTPMVQNTILATGMLIDYFVSDPNHRFMPYNTPLEQRAIPPSYLNADERSWPYPSLYRVYEVLEPIPALTGPIASFYEQPGQGTQYALFHDVQTFIDAGSLREVPLEELSSLTQPDSSKQSAFIDLR